MKSNLYIIFFLFILSIPLKVIGQQKITIGDGFITQINNIEKKADSVLINIDTALFGRKTDNLKSLNYTFALESGTIFYNQPKISL